MELYSQPRPQPHVSTRGSMLAPRPFGAQQRLAQPWHVCKHPNGQGEWSTLMCSIDEPSTRFGASTVTTYNYYWAWCSLDAADCTMSTACNAGTVSWAGGEMAWYDRFRPRNRASVDPRTVRLTNPCVERNIYILPPVPRMTTRGPLASSQMRQIHKPCIWPHRFSVSRRLA
jgi:hypothetical protein